MTSVLLETLKILQSLGDQFKILSSTWWQNCGAENNTYLLHRAWGNKIDIDTKVSFPLVIFIVLENSMHAIRWGKNHQCYLAEDPVRYVIFNNWLYEYNYGNHQSD